MKIKIKKQLIENALVKAIPFIETKDMAQITSNVLIFLSDNTMTISATDYQMGLKSTVSVMDIAENGDAVVNGKKLLDIIKILKNDDITIETKGNDLHISQSRSKFKLSLFADGEFPSFPKIDNRIELSIDSMQMVNAFREITPTIDINNPKYEFNGALIDIKNDEIKFISTDTRRLSIVNIESKSDNELSIIIHKSAIIEMQKLILDDIKIYCTDTYLVIESDYLFFFTKLINGKFPDVERIIPKESIHNVIIDKLLMIESLKLINTISDEVKIEISNGKMLFSSTEDINNKAVTDIDIDFESDDSIVFGFNSKYVLDFLSVVHGDKFTMSLNESSMPFVLESEQLKTIVMPIIL